MAWAAWAAAAVMAVSKMAAAENQATSLENSAQVGENNAKAAEAAAVIEEAKARREGGKVMGAQRANYGASGLTLTGSAMWVQDDTSAQIELDAANIKYQGDRQAAELQYGAATDRWSAGNARTAEVLGAVGSILGGASNASAASAASQPSSMYTSGTNPSNSYMGSYNAHYVSSSAGVRIN